MIFYNRSETKAWYSVNEPQGDEYWSVHKAEVIVERYIHEWPHLLKPQEIQ